MIILQYHEIFFWLTAPRCPGMAAGAVSLKKSHDIVISSFCNIVNGQANSTTSYPASFFIILPPPNHNPKLLFLQKRATHHSECCEVCARFKKSWWVPIIWN